MSKELNNLRYCDTAAAVTDLWLSLPRRDGSLCPEKKDFSPVKLGKYLSSVVLYERMDSNRIIVRVAGTQIREFLGSEITGQNLIDIFPPEFVPAYITYYDNLRAYPCAGIVERPIRVMGGAAYLVKTLQLPLMDENGEIKYFFGTSQFSPLPKQFTDIRSAAMTASRNLKIQYHDIGAGTPDDGETSQTRGITA